MVSKLVGDASSVQVVKKIDTKLFLNYLLLFVANKSPALSVYPSVCQYVCLSICMYVHPHACLSGCLSYCLSIICPSVSVTTNAGKHTIYIYIYTHTHTQRERGRERESKMISVEMKANMHTYTHTDTHGHRHKKRYIEIKSMRTSRGEALTLTSYCDSDL